MPETDFSESQYEFTLGHELISFYGSNMPLFKPTTVLENILGYDHALNTNYFNRTGIQLRNPLCGIIPPGHLNNIPNIYVSAFLQYKRPFYVTRRNNKTIWNHWNGPYYRYEIQTIQNRTLYSLENKINKSSVVLYASPVFHSFSNLFYFRAANCIADNSNFVSPTLLQGHTHYTYINTTTGRAFSDDNGIKQVKTFEEYIQEVLDKGEDSFFLDHVNIIAKEIEGLEEDGLSEICIKLKKIAKINQDIFLKQIGDMKIKCQDGHKLIKESLLIENIIFIYIFMRECFNIDWIISIYPRKYLS